MSGINDVTQIMESPSWAVLLIIFGILCLCIVTPLIITSLEIDKLMPAIIGVHFGYYWFYIF